jgi:hypothetical protein
MPNCWGPLSAHPLRRHNREGRQRQNDREAALSPDDETPRGAGRFGVQGGEDMYVDVGRRSPGASSVSGDATGECFPRRAAH